MWSRILPSLVFAFTYATAQPASADDEWLRSVAKLRSSGSSSFQVRAEIGAGPEQIIAHLSCAPSDRRCLVLRDSFDGVPLMIATDGVAWLYDPIGGQILRIRAEPEFLAERDESPIHVRWGMRADFPDASSYTTIRLDFGSLMRSLSGNKPEKLIIDRASRSAEFTDEKMKVKLSVDQHDPPRPTGFSLDHDDGTRHTVLRCDSFVYDAPVPSWHREVNLSALSKHLRVRAVRDAAMFPRDVQENMGKVRDLLQGGGLFIIRPALRDAELRRAFEKNSPVQIDFDEVKANDETLREQWLKALREQGLEFPDTKTTDAPK